MAAKSQKSDVSKKRKRISGAKGEKMSPKKLKLRPNKDSKKPFKLPKHQPEANKPNKLKKPVKNDGEKKDYVDNKHEAKLRAKELTEARKKKRRRHYTLEQELASLWERMRCRDIAKEDRSKLISDALKKMKEKIPEIAGSHVSSRVLQTCVKYCSQDERDAVFKELRPHFLTLACNTYAVHLVTKMLDNASKEQLAEFISSLHGHVSSLLRHMVGSVVIEHAYQLGNATQKRALVMELYSTELQLFKDLVAMKESRLVDIISNLQLQKGSVLRHMSSVLEPILEKGILDHSIIHKALMEYLSIADQSSAADVIQQLSGPLLVRMIHTKDGSKIGILCLKHGSAKERKKIIKGMKDQIDKIAHDKCGSMVLVCMLSVVDDTTLINKIVIKELKASLKELVIDKIGRRPLLQLLHPNSSRYFSPDDLALLSLYIPSLSTKGGGPEINSDLGEQRKSSEVGEVSDEDKSDTDAIVAEDEDGNLVEGGKKDPFVRREELLLKSGLAESLIDTCCEQPGELLRSQFGKDVIYEVVTGGSGAILQTTLGEKLNTLYEAIASLVAQPKLAEQEEEHLLENFHSSRTIRKMVLDCPKFASNVWTKALKGKGEMWAQGHSCKVISAFMETSSSEVRELARADLQPLVDSGVLRLPKANQLAE